VKRQERDQVVRKHIGIRSTTLQVEVVSETRGGMLYTWRGDERIQHRPLTGRSAEHECVVVFGLTDVYSYDVGFSDSKSIEQRLAELQAKAKEERERRQSLGGTADVGET
jgi:hypothetical protein